MHSISIRKAIISLFPIKPFIRRNETIFPYYHVVSDAPIAHIRHLYSYRDIAGFRRDLDIFLRYYRPIGLSEVIDVVSGCNAVKEPAFHLTFDDGFRECHDIIAPILKQKGVPATFFVCTDFLDNADMYYKNRLSILLDKTNGHLESKNEIAVKQVFNNNGIPYTGFHDTLLRLNFKQGDIIGEVGLTLGIDIKNYLKNIQPYLTSDQIRSLLSDGFTIGSHSRNHPRFSSLTLVEQTEQVRESLESLQKNFDPVSRAFAFPHSDSGVSVQFYNETNRYTDIYFGTGKMIKDCIPNSIQRFSMENRHFTCEEILKQNYLLRAFGRFTGRDTLYRTR